MHAKGTPEYGYLKKRETRRQFGETGGNPKANGKKDRHLNEMFEGVLLEKRKKKSLKT